MKSALVALLFALGCGSAQPRAAKQEADAMLALDCPVADAEVWVDGHFIATSAEVKAGLVLSPGVHRLIVKHDQFHAAYVRVNLLPGQRKSLAIELARRFH